MSVQGISHLTFVVRDLERTARLFCDGLGAVEVYDSAGFDHSLSREKFFRLGGVWLVAMEGEPASRSYRHVAFSVRAEELPVIEARLASLGVEFRTGRPRVAGKGTSLYFYDHDNHLFELHTGTLSERLRAYGRS